MHDMEQRLIKCFSAVFPELSSDDIVKASSNTTGVWDSLTAVTLVAVIEEEFGIQLEPSGTLEDMSFENLLARIAKGMEEHTQVARVHG